MNIRSTYLHPCEICRRGLEAKGRVEGEAGLWLELRGIVVGVIGCHAMRSDSSTGSFFHFLDSCSIPR